LSKINNLRSSIIRPEIGGVCLLAGLLFLLASYIFFKSYSSNNFLFDQTLAYNSMISEIQSDVEKIENFSKKLKLDSREEVVFNKKKITESISNEKINLAIQKWQQISGIEYLSVSFKDFKILNNHNKLCQLSARLEIKTLKDNNFYKFLSKLEDEMPVVTFIESFSLTKSSKFNAQYFEKNTSNKNDQIKPIFNGWIEIKLIFFQ
jgi:hypothetical protein